MARLMAAGLKFRPFQFEDLCRDFLLKVLNFGGRMKKLFAIAAIAALISVSALAQTANTPATNWTGYYAGLNTGGTIGTSNARIATVYLTTTAEYFPQAYAANDVAAFNSAGNQNLTSVGYAGGLQFGYNRQIAKWVVGTEADYGALAASKTTSQWVAYPNNAPYGGTLTQRVSTDWLSTVRARVGHTYGKRTLLFASAGVAETTIHYYSQFQDWDDTAECASPKVLKTGWIIGGGAEYKLDKHWSARAEYLYADFGQVSSAGNVLSAIGGSGTFPSMPFTHVATLQSNIVRFGVNYRF
jgi:outer membrane immunogenic protein